MTKLEVFIGRKGMACRDDSSEWHAAHAGGMTHRTGMLGMSYIMQIRKCCWFP